MSLSQQLATRYRSLVPRRSSSAPMGAPYRARTTGKDERGVGCVSAQRHAFISWAAFEEHVIAERPRLDFEEGAGVARLPAFEGIRSCRSTRRVNVRAPARRDVWADADARSHRSAR